MVKCGVGDCKYNINQECMIVTLSIDNDGKCEDCTLEDED